jgi:hypothetical protein
VVVAVAVVAVSVAVASHAAQQQAAQRKPSIHQTTTSEFVKCLLGLESFICR